MRKNVLPDLWSDAWRIAGILIAAIVVLLLSPYVAGALSEPGIEVFGVYTSMLLGGVAVAHVVRRLLFPGIGMRRTAKDASLTPVGSGLVFIGICLVLAAVILGVRPVAASVPENAKLYLPILIQEQQRHWSDAPMPSALASQVEQETCRSLRHPECWSPHATLRTSREYGFGLGQLTVTSRFNAFAEMTARHASLKSWRWENRFDPQMQARALVLKMKDNYVAIKDTHNEWGRLAMALSAYNGGLGGLNQDRRLCRATPGCDPSRWSGNVERTSYKAKIAVSGYGKSFFAINREYVRNVMTVRRPKYDAWFRPNNDGWQA